MSFFGNLSDLFKVEENKAKVSTKSQSASGGQKPKRGFKKKSKIQRPIQTQKPQPQVDTQAIVREAQAKAREIIVEAKDEAFAIKSKAELNARKTNQQLEDKQRQLNRQLDKVEFQLDQITDKEKELSKKNKQTDEFKQKLEASKTKILQKLEEVAGMTRDEANKVLLDGVEKKISQQLAQVVRQKTEEAQLEAENKAREILVDTMRHGSTNYVAEYTVSRVELPNEESKGKIIGKSGRNIHAFEKVTGVDVDLDDSPTTVRLSCFDPVRREIAKIALEKLIKDGRIQPSRIEDTVAETKQKIDKITFEAGKKLCHAVGVYNLPNGLIQQLGRFKYRFSYGQNMIQHTLEETKIGIKIAHELKADVNVVRLGCLLHDVGKVSEEVEGSHVELGVKIAKKYNMPKNVVDCIAQHHEDEPFSGPEQMIVYIADSISGARPGARYENHEEYVERLESLEKIATSYDGVKQAYAVQAGREIRILLDPEKTKDDDVEILSLKIRDQIKEEMTYPGTVTVTVAREKKSKQIAE
ncbi:MAG: ribonuclease Y [Patescibacteria group bacterium]